MWNLTDSFVDSCFSFLRCGAFARSLPFTPIYMCAVRYDSTTSRVVSEPVEIAQEYRSFEYSSPWGKQGFENLPEESRPMDPSQIESPKEETKSA